MIVIEEMTDEMTDEIQEVIVIEEMIEIDETVMIIDLETVMINIEKETKKETRQNAKGNFLSLHYIFSLFNYRLNL